VTMSEAEWKEVVESWSSSFQEVLDALLAADKKARSKQDRRQLKLAIKTTEAHRRIILRIIEVLRGWDQTLHSHERAPGSVEPERRAT
jgi:hypothetical protein